MTYSVHTQAGADLGGNVKDNQVCGSRIIVVAVTLQTWAGEL